MIHTEYSIKYSYPDGCVYLVKCFQISFPGDFASLDGRAGPVCTWHPPETKTAIFTKNGFTLNTASFALYYL